MTFEDLHAEALRLTPEARTSLAHDLVMSLDALSSEAIEELWLEEAERRDKEMDEGKAEGLPGEEVLARLRARHP